MAMWHRPTAVSLLAAHLRGELERGRWTGRMPGVIVLARELGAARKTVEGALRELERDGLLVAQGHGRGRVISAAEIDGRRPPPRRGMRVAILPYEPSDRGLHYLIELQHQLEEAGHVVDFTRKTLLDLKRDVERVAAYVEQTSAEAWILVGGPRDVLEWFAAQPLPAFALFGRRRGVPIAGGGPDKVPAMSEVVRRLCGLGHRRIVLFVRGERRAPHPGAQERAFLEEMETHGIPTGPYHLPDWTETPEGFLESLDRLYATTPPTALIFDEPFMFAAAQQHLSQRGILAPNDVSLVCCDPPGIGLSWLRPSMAHIRWESGPVVRRVLQWAANASRRKNDVRQIDSMAGFVEGGTIGPAPDR
jgi:DNA-binding LacI/PurR family transcriptional regulator